MNTNYTPIHAITVGPQYAEVFLNETRTRVGIRLLRMQGSMAHPTIWMDIKILPDLIPALTNLLEISRIPPFQDANEVMSKEELHQMIAETIHMADRPRTWAEWWDWQWSSLWGKNG